MPTERFYNLSEEKKKVIREAAIEEFIRVPFEKASINKMIQAAGISRGSFYTYFEDKRDVLGYIFENAGDGMKKTWCRCVEMCGGNLWKASEEFLEYSMVHTSGDMFRLTQNMIVFQDFERIFGNVHRKHPCSDDQKNAVFDIFFTSVDRSDFERKDKDILGPLMAMIFTSLLECMGWYYHHPEDKENIKKIFREKLEILQYGICKR